MKSESHAQKLSCNSCHGAHAYDVVRAAVESCLTCHDDSHSRAFMGSPHEVAWKKELSGQLEPLQGVSCATCHMPTVTKVAGGEELIVQHNQNDNLRPNEKMVRSVCARCHGLSLTLDALADPALIQRNFRGRPRRHVESLGWTERNLRTARERTAQ